jgi:general secretion pathway protein K
MDQAMSNERGSVTMLIALLAAVIMSLGLGFNWLVREHIKNSEGLRTKAEAIIKTRSAYDDLIYIMLTGKRTENAVIIGQRGITGLQSIPIDGSEVIIEGEIFAAVQDSNGRLSLAADDQEPLKRFLRNEAGVAVGAILMDSFQDWIDRDGVPRANGAEASYYTGRGGGYRPRNFQLQYMEELSLIRGMDADLYKRLSPRLTILPITGFNPNTACDAVLKAYLDIDDKTVEKIRTQVAKKPIKTMPELVALTGKAPYLGGAEPPGWFEPSSHIDITVRAGSPRGIYKISTGLTIGYGIFYPFFIHYWREE